MEPVFRFIYMIAVMILVILFVAGIFVPPVWFAYFLCGWFTIDAFVKFMASLVEK
ncbi:hypothetical protein dhaeg_270 [Escherichia phage dhaeg]|nr:hypothetical protein dhaeg_270 [Escherichia phage dhaeg]